MGDVITRIQFGPSKITIYAESGVYVIIRDVKLARGFSNAVASICEEARNAQRIIDDTNARRAITAKLEVEH